MADPTLRLKRSSVQGKVPTADNLPLGEVALNTYDGYLYASKNVGLGTTVIAINPFRVGTGTDTYDTFFTAGNVGIGLTNPSQRLDVSGNVLVSGVTTSTGGFVGGLTCDASSNNTITFDDGSGNIDGRISIATTTNELNGSDTSITLVDFDCSDSSNSRLRVNGGLEIRNDGTAGVGSFYSIRGTDSAQLRLVGGTSSDGGTIEFLSSIDYDMPGCMIKGIGNEVYSEYNLRLLQPNFLTSGPHELDRMYYAQATINQNLHQFYIAGGGFLGLTNTDTGANTNLAFYISNTSGTAFQVRSNGNVENTNNSYGATSDVKLKENIVDASSQWDDIKGIRVRNFNLKENQTHTQIGVIAQEIETVSPGLVNDIPDLDDEGNDLGTVTKSVNYSVLYMKAVKALQEAMVRIEDLEARITALEG